MNMKKDSNQIKVTVSVHAKYQAFRLVEGLNRHKILDKLYTIYPKFKIFPYQIPKNKIRSFYFLGALKYLISRLKIKISDNFIGDIFDKLVSISLKNPNGKWIFHGWSGFCEKSLIRAKKLKGITFIDRPCPHIDFQRELLAEEKSRLLNKYFSPEKNITYKKMKREYEITDYIIVPSKYTFKSFIERGFHPPKLILVPDRKSVV